MPQYYDFIYWLRILGADGVLEKSRLRKTLWCESVSYDDGLHLSPSSHQGPGLESVYKIDVHFLWQDNLHPLDIIWQGLIDWNEYEPSKTFKSWHGKDMDIVSCTKHLHHLLILQMKSCPWILRVAGTSSHPYALTVSQHKVLQEIMYIRSLKCTEHSPVRKKLTKYTSLLGRKLVVVG